MNLLLLLAFILFPFQAFAYVGPAIAGIFGSVIGLGGIILISIFFVIAWPVAQIYLRYKKRKNAKSSKEHENDKK